MSNDTLASMYRSAVNPLMRKGRRSPYAYEGLVYRRTAPPATVAQLRDDPAYRDEVIVWRTGAVRLRTLASLLAQAEVLRLRIEPLQAEEARHRAGLARRYDVRDGLRAVRNAAGEVTGWLPTQFTRKGATVTEATRAKMRAAALRSWASGTRPRPTWLNPRAAAEPAPLPDEPRPVKRPGKAPQLRLVSSKGKR